MLGSLEGTIKEYLRFGNLEATDREIVEAAKAANVDHFIRTLPQVVTTHGNEPGIQVTSH